MKQEHLEIFPMSLHVGDRITEDGEEWEVVEGPSTRTGGKAVYARIRRPDNEREMIWPEHEKVRIRRERRG